MSTASTTGNRARRSRVALLVSALLLVVSAGAAGTSWAMAENDESLDLAIERNQALQDGRQALINVNTFDYRNVEKSLNRWEKSSTGSFHEAVVQFRKDKAEQLKQVEARRESRILDAALTELNVRAGKARMIASVEVTTTQQSQSGNSQDGNSQDGSSQSGNSQDGSSQDGNSQSGNSQDGSSQSGNSQDGNSQDGKPMVRRPRLDVELARVDDQTWKLSSLSIVGAGNRAGTP